MKMKGFESLGPCCLQASLLMVGNLPSGNGRFHCHNPHYRNPQIGTAKFVNPRVRFTPSTEGDASDGENATK